VRISGYNLSQTGNRVDNYQVYHDRLWLIFRALYLSPQLIRRYVHGQMVLLHQEDYPEFPMSPFDLENDKFRGESEHLPDFPQKED